MRLADGVRVDMPFFNFPAKCNDRRFVEPIDPDELWTIISSARPGSIIPAATDNSFARNANPT